MPNRTLFVGTNQQALEDEALAWADSVARNGIGRVLYLSQVQNRHDRVRQRWRKSYDHLALRTETLDSFAYDCYEQLEGLTIRIPEETERRALECSLDRTIEAHPWLSTQSYASAQLVDAFDRRFARFQNVGLDSPEQVRKEFRSSTLPSRISDTTVDLYETYHRRRNAVSEPWHVSYSQVIKTVTDADLDELAPHVDAVVVSDFFEPGETEQSVLQALFETFPTAVVLPTFSPSRTEGVDTATETMRDLCQSFDFEVERTDSADGSSPLQRVAQSLYRDQPHAERSVPEELRWRELPTPEREVRYVARDIRARLADETTPLDIGVVVPGLHAYEDYFSDVFKMFGLEYDVETATALTDTFVGSAVENLVSLSDPQPRTSDLTELVTNPLVEFVDGDGEDAIVAAERRVDSVRVDAVQQQLSPALSSAVQTLLDRLTPLRSDQPDEAVETLRDELERSQIFDAIERDDSRIHAGQERSALDRVQRILTSFETVAPETGLSLDAALLRAIRGASVHGRSASSNQITVLEHVDARGFAFDHLYIVGLTTEYFPTVRRYPAFFEQMVDAHPILEVLDTRIRDRYLFATLLANAGAVTLTTPSTDPDSTAVVRSPVLDELHRITGIEPTTGVDERIGSREDLQRAISSLENRRVALDTAGERSEFTVAQTVRADRGVQCATERADPNLSPRDGLLTPETVAAVYPESEREPYSASRVERYVNCGFQFYMEHVLGFEESEDVERTPDPLETGTFVHDTFERFYADLQSESGDGVALREYDRAELEAHMLETALAELADADFEYSGLFYRRWLEQFFAGLADQVDNPHYGEERPHGGDERGLFSRFVEREYDRDGDALPAWFEAPFGAGLHDSDGVDPFEIDLPNGGTVEFRGYIDRVDISPDGEEIQLFDYKTGSTPSMTKTTGGTTFQLPIYLLAAEQVLTDEGVDPTTLAATYYQTKPPNKLKEPGGIESKFDSPRALRRFLEEVVPERVETLTTAIEHGRFHTTLLGQREAGCEYCAYQRSCDVRPHQRRERIDLLEDDPKTYVPVRATARDFDDEFGGEADD
jgi:ATP-dependent helicase/nuclease subunit B